MLGSVNDGLGRLLCFYLIWFFLAGFVVPAGPFGFPLMVVGWLVWCLFFCLGLSCFASVALVPFLGLVPLLSLVRFCIGL